MSQHVDLILNKIAAKNPRHAEKLREDLLSWDQPDRERFERFYDRYENYLEKEGRMVDFGVDAYLEVIEATMKERMQQSLGNVLFSEPIVGNDRFDDQTHLNGMMFARFLWRQQFELDRFFNQYLPEYAQSPIRYLELCGDQWVWIESAMDQLGWIGVYDLIGLKKGTSNLAREYMPGRPISFFHGDFESFEMPYKYDVIVLGEILGYMSDPLATLKQARTMLVEGGTIFLTATVNAPIRSRRGFSSLHLVREIIADAGLKVEQEVTIVSDDLPMEQVEPLKAAISYGAFLKV